MEEIGREERSPGGGKLGTAICKYLGNRMKRDRYGPNAPLVNGEILGQIRGKAHGWRGAPCSLGVEVVGTGLLHPQILEIKLFAPRELKRGRVDARSRLYPQVPGEGGGCMTASGEDSMTAIQLGRVQLS